MKKYDVRGLNIISVKEGKNIRYLLCKYNCLKNCYIDIFTKEKINVEDKNNIYNLCDNITFIVETDYVVGDKMILDKKALFGIWENVRNELYLTQSEKLIKLEQSNTLFDYDNILNNAILNFFPEEGCWSGCCSNKTTELMSNLPYHLRDDVWLAKMIKTKNNLYFISDSKILDFIKNSTLFIEKRKEYELKIVKWQINHILTTGENWIWDENYGGNKVRS